MLEGLAPLAARGGIVFARLSCVGSRKEPIAAGEVDAGIQCRGGCLQVDSRRIPGSFAGLDLYGHHAVAAAILGAIQGSVGGESAIRRHNRGVSDRLQNEGARRGFKN